MQFMIHVSSKGHLSSLYFKHVKVYLENKFSITTVIIAQSKYGQLKTAKHKSVGDTNTHFKVRVKQEYYKHVSTFHLNVI